jgi:hypothetical protein
MRACGLTHTVLRVDAERTEKRMRLRYSGTCNICGITLAAKTEAIYDRANKIVRCVTHEPPAAAVPARDVVETGTPGSSARREFERRKTKH